MDINRKVRSIGNSYTVNKEIITLDDRNIDNVVINCYSNLRYTKLVAYSVEYSDNATEFKCENKAQLDKMMAKYKKKKNIKNTDEGDFHEMLKDFDTDVSINIDNIHNNFKILKLKYIMDPLSTKSDPRLMYDTIQRTLASWDQVTSQYSHVVNDTKEYLMYLLEDYKKQAAESQSFTYDPMTFSDLYIVEQMVLVPIYDNDSKYVINGIKYYGVFNNCDIGILTKHGKFGFKVFKNGSIYTMYLFEYRGVLLCTHFNEWVNLFHVLTMKNAIDTPMEEVFPHTDNPKLAELFRNTYEHAKMIERNDPLLNDWPDKIGMPDISKDSHARATFSDKTYVSQVLHAVKEFIRVRDDVNKNDSKRSFEFLGKLEDEIYQELNNKSRTKPTIASIKDLEAAKKRVNLSPNTILSVIKKGSGENVNNMLFTSTSTEPNPFDIFYVFAFMKTSNHTNTKAKKGKAAPALQEEEKYIKWTDSLYLGEFAPKSESNIGRATTLNFSIDSGCIVKRRPIS